MTIELPGTGDRPPLPGADEARADLRAALAVSGGGGEWFSRTLKNLPTDALVFVRIPRLATSV